MSIARLSLNQATTKYWTLPEAISGCVRAGIGAIGVWREPLAELGPKTAASLIADAGLRVSSLCRGGFFTSIDHDLRRTALDDNRRAIDEAAELDAQCLVIVAGGLADGGKDLAGARGRVAEALAELAPYAGDRGVRLALEPLHPMYCADRAVLSTLGQVLELAGKFPCEQVGVVVDTFHVWWDPELLPLIALARDRIASYQVCDWITPLPSDVLLARGMLGDGHIDFRPITAAVLAAGYRGDIEVEVFNQQIWDSDYDDVLATVRERFATSVVS